MDSGGSAQSSSGGADEEFDSSCPPQPPGDHSATSASVFSPSMTFASPNPLLLNPNFTDNSIWPAPIRSQQQQPHPEHHHPHLSAVVKNPKKRTRASRRAPTTVLTTDTSNFRQMVQEFTGIPPSPFGSRRLDLFSAPGALRLGPLDSLGPLYSSRPPIPLNTTPFIINNSTTIDSTTLLPPPQSTMNPNPQFPNNSSYLLPLHLGGNIPPLGGFPNQESGSRNNNDEIRGWASGETVRSNDGNVGDTGGYDGNVDSSRHRHHHHQQQQQRHVSDYNLNLSEKAAVRENTAAAAAAPQAPQGNVGSWMYPSQ